MNRWKYLFVFAAVFMLFGASAWAGPKPSGDFIIGEFSDEYDHSTSSFNSPWAARSHISIDEQGTVTHNVLASTDGSGDVNVDYPFKIFSDGLFKIFADSQNPDFYFPGAVSPDGNYFALSLIHPEDPGIGFGLKYPTTTPNVVGKSYWACQFNNWMEDYGNGPVSVPVTMFLQIDLNANNQGYHWDIARTRGPIEEGPFEYTVDESPADGNLTISVTVPNEGTFSFTGIVSEDASIFTFPFLSEYEPGVMIGIEKATVFTVDKTKGKYFLVEIDDKFSDCQNPQLGSWPWAGMTQIIMDGLGSGTFKEVYTTDTDDQDFPMSGEFTYSVTSDGKITVTTPEGDLDGFISADGNLFVIPGLDPCEPGITIGIKGSPTSLLAPTMLLLGE